MKEILPFDLNEVPIDEDVFESEGQMKEEIVDEPFVGQCFLSEEEALVFYQKYAEINAFSVRKGRFDNKKGDNKGERKIRDFFCHREGKPGDKLVDYSKKQRNRVATRCECMAIRKNKEIEVKHHKASRMHKVNWDGNVAKCSCKNFEFVGILCRHILSVLVHKDCFEIPLIYWTPRWRRQEIECDELSISHQEESSVVAVHLDNVDVPSVELVERPPRSITKGRPKKCRLKPQKELIKQVKRPTKRKKSEIISDKEKLDGHVIARKRATKKKSLSRMKI